MLEGPIGAAAFNNEFGRPNLCGYFRTYEEEVAAPHSTELRGYHKPIMLAGGLGNIREEHIEKPPFPAGSPLVVLGGPAMLIGLGVARPRPWPPAPPPRISTTPRYSAPTRRWNAAARR